MAPRATFLSHFTPPLKLHLPWSASFELHHLFRLMSRFLLPLPSQLRRAIFQQAQSYLCYYQQPAPHFRLCSSLPANNIQIPTRRSFRTSAKMSDLSIELTAPNGTKYTQPTGLFINNEWVKSSNGQKLTSINPTYAPNPLSSLELPDNPQR